MSFIRPHALSQMFASLVGIESRPNR